MGFLKRFSRAGGAKDASEEKSVISTTSTTSLNSKRSSKSSASLKTSRKSPQGKVVVAKEAKKTAERKETNAKIIDNFFASIKDGFTAEDFLAFFESPEVPIVHEDIPTITAGVFAEMMLVFQPSFPDLKVTADSKEDSKPGVVVSDDCIVAGTFTGAPFAPLPHLTPIEANGRNVFLDPERIFFTVENGKITKMEVIAMGNHTGPVGFYILAGGKM